MPQAEAGEGSLPRVVVAKYRALAEQKSEESSARCATGEGESHEEERNATECGSASGSTGPCGTTTGTEGAEHLVTWSAFAWAPGVLGASPGCCRWGGLGHSRGPPADGGQHELRALWISNLFESSLRTRLRVRAASSVRPPEGP